MKYKFLIMLFLSAVFLTGFSFAQGTVSLTDTARFFPEIQEFPNPENWQITNQKINMHSRQAESQTITGYRYILDKNTAPRTGLTFNIIITKIRPGQVTKANTGTNISRARYAYERMEDVTRQAHVIPPRSLDFGDASFEAQKDPQSYK
ncbi:MAG: hypothetical protein ACLFQV_09280, partial [Vulcanimicrobiota bacterium]